MFTRSKQNNHLQPSTGQSGQIIVEYVLLLVIGVAIALLITTQMVSRNPENPGFIITKWRQIIELIGSDKADDLSEQSE